MNDEENEQVNPTLSFSLTVNDGDAALDFYRRAFGAEEVLRMPMPDGSVAHAEFMIGNSKVYLSEESPEWHAYPMPTGTRASCLFSIETDDCDTSHQKAVDAGATPLNEPEDQFWGMRSSMVLDPFGYRWSFGQLIETISPEEVMRRAQALETTA